MRSIEWLSCWWPWVTPNPLNHQNCCIFPFHIFVVGQHRDFRFGTQVGRSQSQHTDYNTVPERDVVTSRHPSVCLSVCSLAYLKNYTAKIYQFLCMLSVVMTRSCCRGVLIRYVLPVCGWRHVFTQWTVYGACSRVFVSGKGVKQPRLLRWFRFCSAIKISN